MCSWMGSTFQSRTYTAACISANALLHECEERSDIIMEATHSGADCCAGSARGGRDFTGDPCKTSSSALRSPEFSCHDPERVELETRHGNAT